MSSTIFGYRASVALSGFCIGGYPGDQLPPTSSGSSLGGRTEQSTHTIGNRQCQSTTEADSQGASESRGASNGGSDDAENAQGPQGDARDYNASRSRCAERCGDQRDGGPRREAGRGRGCCLDGPGSGRVTEAEFVAQMSRERVAFLQGGGNLGG